MLLILSYNLVPVVCRVCFCRVDVLCCRAITKQVATVMVALCCIAPSLSKKLLFHLGYPRPNDSWGSHKFTLQMAPQLVQPFIQGHGRDHRPTDHAASISVGCMLHIAVWPNNDKILL